MGSFLYQRVCKTYIRNTKTHFKDTRETASFLRGMNLNRAKTFLKNVCFFKEIVPFKRYKYGIGRKSQNKIKKGTNGRWPIKSAQILLKALKNIEEVAYRKNFNLSCTYVQKIQINKSMTNDRRTFRAHGRVNSFSAHPCHIELWLCENFKPVEKSFI